MSILLLELPLVELLIVHIEAGSHDPHCRLVTSVDVGSFSPRQVILDVVHRVQETRSRSGRPCCKARADESPGVVLPYLSGVSDHTSFAFILSTEVSLELLPGFSIVPLSHIKSDLLGADGLHEPFELAIV